MGGSMSDSSTHDADYVYQSFMAIRQKLWKKFAEETVPQRMSQPHADFYTLPSNVTTTK